MIIQENDNSFQSNVDKTIQEQQMIQDISLNGNGFSQKNVDETVHEQLLMKEIASQTSVDKTIQEQLSQKSEEPDTNITLEEQKLVDDITLKNQTAFQDSIYKTIQEQLLISEIANQKQNSQMNVDEYIKATESANEEALENPLYGYLVSNIEYIKNDILSFIQKGYMANNPYLYVNGQTYGHNINYKILSEEVKGANNVALAFQDYLNKECIFLEDGTYSVDIKYVDYAPKQQNSKVLSKQGYYSVSISLKQKQKLREK